MGTTIISYLSEMTILHGADQLRAIGLEVPSSINPLEVSPLPLEKRDADDPDELVTRASKIASQFPGESMFRVTPASTEERLARADAERSAMARIRSEKGRAVSGVQCDLGIEFSYCWLFLYRVYGWSFPSGYGVVVDHATRRALLRTLSGAIAIARPGIDRLSGVVTRLDEERVVVRATAAPPPSFDGDEMFVDPGQVPERSRTIGAIFDLLVDGDGRVVRVLASDEEG